MPTYSSSSWARASMAASSARAPRVQQHGAEHAGAGTHVAADHHVLDRAQVGEQADVLERARQAGIGHFMRLLARHGLTIEGAGAVLRDIQAGQHVEQRGLARAVGADQAVDLALLNVEADVRQGLQAAEAFAQSLGLQQFAHAASPWALLDSSRLRTADGHRPAGRNSITQTMARPNNSMRMPSDPAPRRRTACAAPVRPQRAGTRAGPPG